MKSRASGSKPGESIKLCPDLSTSAERTLISVSTVQTDQGGGGGGGGRSMGRTVYGISLTGGKLCSTADPVPDAVMVSQVCLLSADAVVVRLAVKSGAGIVRTGLGCKKALFCMAQTDSFILDDGLFLGLSLPVKTSSAETLLCVFAE